MQSQTIMLNLTPGGIPPRIHVSQYDVKRPIAFQLVEGLQQAAFTIPSGTTALLRATKPDHHGVAYSSADNNSPVSYSGSTVTFQTTQQFCAAAGEGYGEIRLTKSGQDIGSANFIYIVEKAGLADDVDMSGSELPAIIDLAERNANAAAASATAAAGSATAAAGSASQASSSAAAASASATSAAVSKSDAASSATSANNAKTSAQYYQSLAKSWAVGPAGSETAGTDTNNAKYHSQQASTSATTAAAKATLAESYAKGGTSSRTGEDTDNALYYKNQASQAKTDAETAAGTAEDALEDIQALLATAWFTVDFTTGELMYTEAGTIAFEINTTTGNLEWEVVA